MTTTARLFTPAFVLLGLADLGYFTAVGVAIYTLPLYVTGPVGSDTAGAGLAFGAFAVSALILRPFAGRLSDRIGRRVPLVGGALLAAVALALTPLADTLLSVVALRLALGVAEAAFVVAGFAALADLAPPSRLGEALSYNSLGLYLGLALGPPLGELLLERGSFTVAWVGAAVVVGLSALAVLGIGETRAPTEPTSGPVQLIHRGALAPGIGFFTSVMAMSGFLAFVSLHAREVGLAATSLPLFVYGAVVVVCRIVFAKVPDRLPSLSLASAALVVMAVGLSTMALWTTPVGLITGAVLMALGITFSTPAFFSAIFSSAGPGDRGAAAGTASAFLDLGLGGGPILLGLVARSAGIPWAFGVAAGVALVGYMWTVTLLRRKATRPAQA
ncbi:MFS transporter [Actinokineospora xionganensis]|uniref:MFS transporter n=1 Tax=Actinokineospora xionganensis TaxID=2684470 RepID=A0ABR7L7R5_9PSEU|nr:MFS transporter [Actinokineospora xionganensis]MBC6448736.1 MFS transporter [Actinokineospora xionganensis]